MALRASDDAQGGQSKQVPTAWFRRVLLEYGFAVGASVVLAIVLLQLWDADLRVPFDYGGDASFFGMIVKSVVDEGWYLTNSHLSAPFVLKLHDFPIFEAFHLGAIKVMALFSHDWALLFNLYFLLGFPLITVSALAVFRHFRVPYAPALAGALLYAFAANRLFTSEAHFFLDIFYQVPIGILVALWVSGDAPPLVRVSAGRRWPRMSLRQGGHRSPAVLVMCAIVASTGMYYAVFLGFLIFFGGIVASIDRRTLTNACAGAVLTGIIVTVLAAQVLPTVLYQWRHGPNPQVAARQPQESEIFGLRIGRLLLPADEHRVPLLRRLKERSDRASAVPRNESSSIGLGAVGGVGFLCLLGAVILRLRQSLPRAQLLRSLAVLNLLAVLFSTTGSFGYLFALIAIPGIRGYSRMSVIIGFLSIFAVVLLIEHLVGERKRLGWVVAVIVTGVGLFDQVTLAAVRPYARVKGEYERDQEFVDRVAASVPGNAMIFQLPYQRFPESDVGPGSRLEDYDQLRFYLHSRTLRWSYPAIYNRSADVWSSNVSERGPAELLDALSATGFAGIVIDRNGYPDKGAAIESALGGRLGMSPAVSAERRVSFFSLVAYNEAVSANLPAALRDRRRRSALQTVSLRWMDGFFAPERGPNGPFHWCPGTCEIQIENPADVALTVTIKMTLFAAKPPASLGIEGDLLSERFDLRRAGTGFSRTVTVSPGRHVLRFHSDGNPADAPLDPRRLVWFSQNAQIETEAVR